ncbi:MAG TPA: hypothetical protein VNJ01_05355 [Bacteriovoracaceae bacterium]|nr:hypothetical protein [Bacteriovoracaceae bacterium]
MTRIVGIFLLLISFPSWALVPVEGLLMGEADTDIQSDPLNLVFSNHYDEGQLEENKKVKLYHRTYTQGEDLAESCSYLGPMTFARPWQQTQARRSIAATLQYLGLDLTVKAIGAYAKKLQIPEGEYQKLSSNILKNYCSQNITVYSIKHLRQSLAYYYQNPQAASVPSLASSPFAANDVKNKTESPEARAREFEQVIKNFRAFCSWGGDPDDYRMLSPYLSNRYIMAFVVKNLSSIKDAVEESSLKVRLKFSQDTVQVRCDNLICRKDTFENFSRAFPQSLGSTGLFTEVSKHYCDHFRMQSYSASATIPTVKAWIKSTELETPILETSMFISLMTGVPDLHFGLETYRDVPLLVKSSIDTRWMSWSKTVLQTFGRTLFYEESLKVKVEPRRNVLALRSEGFRVDFSVTLGEMDRVIQENDKLKLAFELNLSKNFLHSLRSKWNALEKDVDLEGQRLYRQEVAAYVELQLKEKKKYFSQKIWNENFSALIADELIAQSMKYQGPLFDSYSDQIIRVPIKFSYGLFALSYLRNRSEFNSGKYKIYL